MLRRSKHIELPRRIAAYYLLFGILSVIWLAGGLIWVSQAILTAHADNACIAKMRRAATAIGLNQLRNAEAELQPTIERLHGEHGLVYCALVNADRRILAHSDVRQVGKLFQPATGVPEQIDGISKVLFRTSDGRQLGEYALNLQSGVQAWGTLYCGRPAPNLWGTATITAGHASAAMLGASLFVALGAVVVYRAVRPMAEIDRQLRVTARAAALSEVTLYPVEVNSGTELGWNRLVDAGFGKSQQIDLNQRVQEAIGQRDEQRWSTILDSLAEGVLVTDCHGQIDFANRAAAVLCNRAEDAERLRGVPLEKCLNLKTVPDHPLLDNEGAGRAVTVDVPSPSDPDKILRLQRTPIGGHPQGLAGFVWLMRDITQLKLAEKTRDDFLAAATHELRTPLANIKAYAETLVLSEMMNVEQQKAFCNTINTEATRLARVVEDLLNISSMEAGSLTLALQEVDLQRLLQETVTKTQPQMTQKQIQFELLLPEKLPKLQLDKDKFAAAVVNLLGNAVKYTPAGGHVKMQVHHSADHLRIAIHDTGVGISAEELPKVFDKFFRSKDKRVQKEAGTGLGLAFSNEVVRLHRGSLEVQSELNKGSTFTIHLPLN